MRSVLILAVALLASACATNGPAGPPGAQFAELSASCARQGGSLVPTFSHGISGYTCNAGGPGDARYVSRPTEAR
ncbi:MAG: hypothetical protein KKC29_04340 [Alphaproteobacteria bacterium]|nr:hypothetical protein [Alphaproteobacteria bacterium]MBU2290308.1 hypothetical protein [Alphaproteobacteria bacterium]MBU2418712.1 hypothetical protein [Alphaproteobacteria bacterium]